MNFSFDFEAYEKTGRDKKAAVDYLRGLNSSADFAKLEQEYGGDDEAIFEVLKVANFSYSKA
ncbi:hypothetical protein, partial [Campylobacter sp.]|uniref:hypothetical protein n=1 Tax=Campylobacter sp. TaxID=205 RepID=UPI0026DD06E5